MSGRKKRFRQQVIDQMLAKEISVPEARARLIWVKTGMYQAPRQAGPYQGAALNSAGPASVWERYYSSPDPAVRERTREAAQRELVSKAMLPGPAAGRPDPGSVRALVWAPGPDGEPGWQRPQAAALPGLQIAPPERQEGDPMLTRSEVDRARWPAGAGPEVRDPDTRARGAGDQDDAARRRERIQHRAEPYLDDVPEVDLADLDKRFSQVSDVPSGHPEPCRVDPEEFRRGPITPGRSAYSPDYAVGRPVPVPSAARAGVGHPPVAH